MDTMDWVAVVLPVFGIIVGLLGWRWTRAKKLLADVVAILTLISDAVQDDELTRQEVKDIVAEAMRRKRLYSECDEKEETTQPKE